MTADLSPILLETKLRRPQVRSDIVPRPRLYALLDRGRDYPLTLVCGSAGFGKTTTVSAWIEQNIEPNTTAPLSRVGWLSLDKHDGDLIQFIRYFVAAVRTSVPDACRETSMLIDGGIDVPISMLHTVFSNDLAALPQATTVILDDYHLVGGTAIDDLFSALCLHWPEPLHLIILTRYAPALPLITLRAGDQIVEARNRDLRFSREELELYFCRRLPTPLSQRSLDLLELKAEGWIASLQLLSMSMRNAGDIEAFLDTFTGSNIGIASYLLQEVFVHQPPAVQEFLLKTAVLDRFCVDLCKVVFASPDPNWDVDRIIDHLVEADLFIVSLEGQTGWYRYHALFRGFLLKDFWARADPIAVDEMRRNVALWHERYGFVDEAIRYAIRSENVGLAGQMVARNLRDVLNREDRMTLERWLEMLPEDVIKSHPELLIGKALALNWSWQFGAIQQIIRAVESLLEQAPLEEQHRQSHQELLGQLAALQCLEAFVMGRADLGVTFGRESLAKLPKSWTYLRGGLLDYLTVSMQACGQGDTAERELWALYEQLPNRTDAPALRILLALALRNLIIGHFVEVERIAQLMLVESTSRNLSVLEGWANFLLGLVHYEWNDLDAAEQYLAHLVAHWYRMPAMVTRHAAAGLALVHLAQGKTAAAEQVLTFACERDLQNRGRLGAVTQSLQARLWLATGKVNEAVVWAEAYNEPMSLVHMLLWDVAQLTKAQTLLALGTKEAALRALQVADAVSVFAIETHSARRVIQATALRAVIFDALGDATAAEANLLQALALGLPGRIIRIFVDLGRPMHDLLAALPAGELLAPYVLQILAAFTEQEAGHALRTIDVAASPPSNNTHRQRPPALVEPLTRRELDVLTLLREPLGIKEIAHKLNISYATAKRHSINLYGKLGVHSRWDAVAKAEAFGILSPR